MKPVKYLPGTNNNLPNTSEFTYKKDQLNSPSLPKTKENMLHSLYKMKLNQWSYILHNQRTCYMLCFVYSIK